MNARQFGCSCCCCLASPPLPFHTHALAFLTTVMRPDGSRRQSQERSGDATATSSFLLADMEEGNSGVRAPEQVVCIGSHGIGRMLSFADASATGDSVALITTVSLLMCAGGIWPLGFRNDSPVGSRKMPKGGNAGACLSSHTRSRRINRKNVG